MNPRIGVLGTSILVTLIVIGVLPVQLSEAANEATDAAKAAPQHLTETYGRLPLSFESNAGQTVSQVKFLSRGQGYTLFLTERAEAVLVLEKSTLKYNPERPADRSSTAVEPQAEAISSVVLRIKLAGANPTPQVEGLEELPGKVNYFIGNEPKKWRMNVPIYAKVKVLAVYPGVDLVYYGNQRQLEHDFVVAPGADPAAITMAVVGADRLSVNDQGDLVLAMKDGEVRLQKPVVYQDVAGVRREVPGVYRLKRAHQVSFQIAAYDASRPLIIDPVLAYSTYLGGSTNDNGFSIAVDSSGNAYVTGSTISSNFPTNNPITAACNGTCGTGAAGNGDAFVTKLNTTGSALVYSTYLGGSSGDLGNGIAVDSGGNAYVTGQTQSSDFPTTTGAFQTSFSAGFFNAFVTKLNSSGSGLVYSTYLGGGSDAGNAIAVDSGGHAYVTGFTDSSNFPTTPGVFQPMLVGGQDAFVTKVNASGSGLDYSTLLGGNNTVTGSSIAVDSFGSAYVTGSTSSTTFPTTTGAFQSTLAGGGSDAFVTKLNINATALAYSTYLGGGGIDNGQGIAVDSGGFAYVAGFTNSSDFPTKNPIITACNGACGTAGNGDAFVTKLNTTGSALVYSTYLGGSGLDRAWSIAVDSAANAYVTGEAASSNFPTTANAIQPANGNFSDAFLSVLNPLGTTLLYSSYLGGNGLDQGLSIALDASFNAYVTGRTDSTNFPTTTGAFQTMKGGGFSINAFVTKIANIACTQKEDDDDDRDDHERHGERDHHKLDDDRHKHKPHPCKTSGEEESGGRDREKE